MGELRLNRGAALAVNRAYYAAFGEAEDYVTARGFVRRAGAGSHEKIWRYLESGISDSDQSRRAIAAQGLPLKDRRHKADYRRGSKLAKQEPQDAVNEAARIIKALDGLSAGPVKSKRRQK